MKLLLVRHAESRGNATGDYSVITHDSLSPKGEQQAVALAGVLHSCTLAEIVVSPLQRALETIAPYLASVGRRAEIWPEIAEACWQERDTTVSDAWHTEPASVPARLAQWFDYRDTHAVKPAEAESFAEGMRRVHDTHQRLQTMARQSLHTVLMVSHGFFIQELLNLLLGTRTLVMFPHDNCGMTSLAFDGVWHLQFCNRRTNTLDDTIPGGCPF